MESHYYFSFALVECLNYTFLNESNRARTFYSSSFYEKCDSSLDGWYRFGGSAGDHMADSCIPRSHCGTDMPGWLNGSHPTVADGAVNRSVCFSAACPLPDRCCYNSANITVRNCGGFFVYKLKRPPSSKNKARYCGNGLPSVTPGENYIVLIACVLKICVYQMKRFFFLFFLLIVFSSMLRHGLRPICKKSYDDHNFVKIYQNLSKFGNLGNIGNLKIPVT